MRQCFLLLTIRGLLLRHFLDEGGLGRVAVAVGVHVDHFRVHFFTHAIALLRAGSVRNQCGRKSVMKPYGKFKSDRFAQKNLLVSRAFTGILHFFPLPSLH